MIQQHKLKVVVGGTEIVKGENTYTLAIKWIK